jgi:2-polyprenyl-6-methoxyphenol hydroxylase-like FAD-dependent oxidoreductase
MRRIAIVGAGQAGIVLGAELLARGHSVSLVSDRTPEAYLQEGGRPTACLFGESVTLERKLGLNFWEGQAPSIGRIHLDLCTPFRVVAFTISASIQPALAVDQRLKFSRGMQELEKRGAKLLIEEATLPRLDELAQAHDLTVVAVGRKALGEELFPRDPARSVHTQPQRHLFSMSIADCALKEGVGHEHLKFSFIPGIAEIFWVPFFDRDMGPCKNMLIESVIGGPADRFMAVRSADEGLAVLKRFVEEVIPWESAFLKTARPTHEGTWLKGAFTPVVRKPVGTLPSGRHVLGLGDTVILNDPLAGQGSNNATRMAHFFAERIEAHGDKPFDVDWCNASFEAFWEYSRFVNQFSNVMLDPLKSFQQDLLITASQRNDVAAEIFAGFGHPPGLFPWFVEEQASRNWLSQKGVGRMTVLGYKLGIARRVLGQKLFGRA